MVRNIGWLLVSIVALGAFGDLKADPVYALPAFADRRIEGTLYPDGQRRRIWMQVCDNSPFGSFCGENRFDIKEAKMPLGAPREADIGVSSLFMYGFFQLAAATVSLENSGSDKAYSSQAFATAAMALHVLSNVANLDTIAYVWNALWQAKFEADGREEQGICGVTSVEANALRAETLFHKIQALMASFSYDDVYQVAKAAVVEAVRVLTLDIDKVVEIESIMDQQSTWVSAWRHMCGPENLSLRPGTNGTVYPNDYVCTLNSPSYTQGFFSIVGGFEFCDGCKGWLDEVAPVANLNRLHWLMDSSLAILGKKAGEGDSRWWWDHFTPSTYRRFLQAALGNYKAINGLSRAGYALDNFKALTEGSQFYGSVPLDVLNRVLSLLSAWGKQADARERLSKADELMGVYERASMEYQEAAAMLAALEVSLSEVSGSETEDVLLEEFQQASDLLEERKAELEGLEATYRLAKIKEEKAQEKDMFAKAALFEASVRMTATFTKQAGGFAASSQVSKRIADVFNLASPIVLTPTSVYRASEHAIQIKQDWDLKAMAQSLMQDEAFAKDPELIAVLEGITGHSQMMEYVAMFIDVLGVLRNTLALVASSIRVSRQADSLLSPQVTAVQEMIGSYLCFTLWSFTGNLSFSKIILSMVEDWQLEGQQQEIAQLKEAIAQANLGQDYEEAVALSLKLLKVDVSEMAKLLLARLNSADYSVRVKMRRFLGRLGLSSEEIRAIQNSSRPQDAQKLIEIHLQIG